MQIPSQSKVKTVPINIPSVITVIIVRFSVRGLSQREMSRKTGVSQYDI